MWKITDIYSSIYLQKRISLLIKKFKCLLFSILLCNYLGVKQVYIVICKCLYYTCVSQMSKIIKREQGEGEKICIPMLPRFTYVLSLHITSYYTIYQQYLDVIIRVTRFGAQNKTEINIRHGMLYNRHHSYLYHHLECKSLSSVLRNMEKVV